MARGGGKEGSVELLESCGGVLSSDVVVTGLGDVVAGMESEGRAVAVGEAEDVLAGGLSGNFAFTRESVFRRISGLLVALGLSLGVRTLLRSSRAARTSRRL